VLQEEGVSAAIVGASRPEQLKDVVAAAGVRLDPALKALVDEVLAPVVTTDPSLTASPAKRP
jgi:aryl-alcohol dehydrogenase-like predicted oxidoreductase